MSSYRRPGLIGLQVFVPKAVCDVLDTGIQMHGAAGVSDDTMLARAYAGMRGLRIADGPDDVHLRTIGMLEVRRFRQANKKPVSKL